MLVELSVVRALPPSYPVLSPTVDRQGAAPCSAQAQQQTRVLQLLSYIPARSKTKASQPPVEVEVGVGGGGGGRTA